VLSAWADAAADALLVEAARAGGARRGAPVDVTQTCAARLDDVLAEARAEAPWRAQLGLAAPSPGLVLALQALDQLSRTVLEGAPGGSRDGVLAALHATQGQDGQVGRLVRRLLRTSLDAAP
jgi:hypothetical protein